jgi:hypothetical protein
MNKEFVPYEEALALKELGFDEPCLGAYFHAGKRLYITAYVNHGEYTTLAPTFSQSFRWFRYNYWYTALILCDSFEIVMQTSTSKTLDSKTGEYRNNYITQTWHKEVGLKSYDESELACLKRLIEIAKEKAMPIYLSYDNPNAEKGD